MDPIAEMFSQINNAQNASLENLVIPFSNMKLAILGILKEKGYISEYKINSLKVGKAKNEARKIEVKLIKDVRTNISRISRPSRRIYSTSANIPRPRRPQAIVIVSTSKGVLEGEEARKKGLGGELIAEVK